MYDTKLLHVNDEDELHSYFGFAVNFRLVHAVMPGSVVSDSCYWNH
jgi:hypothetical protein